MEEILQKAEDIQNPYLERFEKKPTKIGWTKDKKGKPVPPPGWKPPGWRSDAENYAAAKSVTAEIGKVVK